MPRPHRDQEPGIHHVTARGNARAAIFVDDDDRRLYVARLEWTALDFAWDVLLWCLFGGRFWSAPVESDEHFETLCGYMVNNPVGAGLVPEWRLWPWLGGSLLGSGAALAA